MINLSIFYRNTWWLRIDILLLLIVSLFSLSLRSWTGGCLCSGCRRLSVSTCTRGLVRRTCVILGMIGSTAFFARFVGPKASIPEIFYRKLVLTIVFSLFFAWEPQFYSQTQPSPGTEQSPPTISNSNTAQSSS